MSADLNQLMDKLKGDTPKGQVVVETGKLVSKKKIIRGKNGGVRPNSGRPPKAETLIKLGVKAWIDEHANEKIKVTVMDKKTGKTITIEKPRLAYALEKLYELGTKGEGDAHAINMWLDRYMGKASQPIRGEGENDAPIKLHVDNLADIINKVYGPND